MASEEWERLGEVSTGPGGRLLLADADYVKAGDLNEFVVNDAPDASGAAGCANVAMQTSTGGEGTYQVRALRDGGVIVAVRVDFAV
jgi:hypothetical protein